MRSWVLGVLFACTWTGPLLAEPPSSAAAARPAAAAGAPALPAPDHLYTTWKGVMEVDKCASIWLLQRYFDPQARFEFLPRGTRIERGMSFEIPFAKLERAPGKSLFETLLSRLSEPDLALLAMSRIVHDAEINIWGNKTTDETAGVVLVTNGLSEGARDEQEVVARVRIVFDALHAGLKERLR
ncbi:MAG: chromate resistance protein [Candidatus Wallbacteria bacterium]|nr:chromate resistance protein [Candidatus Wallbacteria bacterium]